jgi:diaminohydroxyphosphoribosylaminopyrimidine deaminase / 5-amino-6-(5-phosphoribosylamino)uracil reductase
VVFDSEARLPATSKLVRSASEVPVFLVCSRAASRANTDALEAAGVELIVATGENEGARVRSALTELGARGITSLLLEGGPHLAGAFLDAGEIDEVRLFVAPILVGGRHARAPLEGQGVELIDSARRALSSEVETVADDVLIRARMTEW